MTQPKNAIQVPGKGRWYSHPVTGEQWPSVTNVLDVSISKPAIIGWGVKLTAQKAWEMLPQMVAASRKIDCKKPAKARCGACQECVSKLIKRHHTTVKDAAADLGTRVHALVEAQVLGKPTAPDPEAQPFVKAALQFFYDFGVNLETDIEAAEATVINRTVGYAGTGDLWVWLKLPGQKRKLYVVDYKTSSTRDVDSVYPENGMQTAAIAKAETILLDDGTEVEPPGPVEGIAILNLRTTGYALMPMPVAGSIDDAFAAFTGALANATYLHSAYGTKPAAVAPPTLRKVA